MEYVVYILYSSLHRKVYIGFTSNLIARFHSHNQLATKGWTIKFRPWKVIYVEFYDNKKEAMGRENFLKSGKGREFIKKEILASI
jgi:putative endonuclease